MLIATATAIATISEVRHHIRSRDIRLVDMMPYHHHHRWLEIHTAGGKDFLVIGVGWDVDTARQFAGLVEFDERKAAGVTPLLDCLLSER